MKSLTIAEAARDLPKLIDAAREADEEIEIVEGGEVVATLVPGAKRMTLAEVVADVGGTLDDQAADALGEAVERARNSPGNRLSAQRKPWAG